MRWPDLAARITQAAWLGLGCDEDSAQCKGMALCCGEEGRLIHVQSEGGCVQKNGRLGGRPPKKGRK